jgi:HAD superfamily hydrolase (TIGR01509 family)
MAVATWHQHRFTDVEELSAGWRTALDVARAAVVAADSLLPPTETHERTVRLADERKEVAHLLEALARDQRSDARLWAVAPWDGKRLLGLSPTVAACVFNLDGVLLGSAAVHAAAWAETFDEFIANRIERTGGLFAPFNPRTDYYKYMHGRPRLDGVRGFLASRGINLPEGVPGDASGAETVHGLANRKGEALTRRLEHEGPKAFAGSHRYLELARDAGVRCAIVSASANARTILERSGLSGLIDGCVDGNTMENDDLRAKPAPDTLLAACRQLGVAPQNAASFETTPAGIAAARTAEFGLVIGVNSNGRAGTLREEGADVVITGLAELLDRNLAA